MIGHRKDLAGDRRVGTGLHGVIAAHRARRACTGFGCSQAGVYESRFEVGAATHRIRLAWPISENSARGDTDAPRHWSPGLLAAPKVNPTCSTGLITDIDEPNYAMEID